jgi:beta-galactosidase
MPMFNLRYPFIILLFIMGITLFSSAAGATPRHSMALLEGWRFSFGSESTAPADPAFVDREWARVSLPHTWNSIGTQGETRGPDVDDRRGKGWYRLTFTPDDPKGRRAWLEFDAVSIVADIWLNGVHLGRHEGAFSRFRLDATRALKPGVANVLTVRADNSRPTVGSATRHVQPIYGGFMMYGGIYRPVRLVFVDPLHVDMADLGGPGVYARAQIISPQAARVAVRARITNDQANSAKVIMISRIRDAAGQVVASARASLRLPAGRTTEGKAELALANPRLWNGRRDPYLYSVEVVIEDRRRRLRDRIVQPLGIRTMRIDASTGFHLNQVRLPLHGVARHQDRAGIGWALRPEHEAEDMRLIMEIGANTIRYSHYNHSENIHDLSDRLGLVAWAELGLLETHLPVGDPDATALALESAKSQLRELIRQNYNHPSVAVWSIGNEVTRLASRQIVPAAPVRGFMAELDRVAKEEDPSRPTTIALCCEPNKFTEPLVGVADTAGYNEYLGWYDGGYAQGASALGARMRALHAATPALPLSISEYGAGASLTQHTDDPFGGTVDFHGRPQPMPVMNVIHEVSWRQISGLPFLWGTWIWNMFDFANPLRPEGDSIDLNTKGLITFDRRTKKDSFHFYKAVWTNDPVVHITDRFYADRAYPVMNVTVYSNAAEVALRIGAAPVRTARCEMGICRFSGVRLVPGDNAVSAEASFGDRKVSDQVVWSYSGDPAAMRILSGTLTGTGQVGNAPRFGSDAFFSGGVGRRLNTLTSRSFILADVDIDKSGWKPAPRLTVAADEPQLYENYRVGTFAYRLPLPDGRYHVTLGFMEPEEKKVGDRIFDVIAGGRKAIHRFDVAKAAGGYRRGVRRSFIAYASNGTLDLAFQPVRGEAVVSHIIAERR